MGISKEQLILMLERKGIHDQQVLRAIKKIPRNLFVEPEHKKFAYDDTALPIKSNQTISQPYIVARMSEALHTSGKMGKVLEIGSGSGYQTAILSELAKQVYTVERIEQLYKLAQSRLSTLNIQNVEWLHGDGYLGWPEHAPYDAILVTAAAKEIPQHLISQLANGGRMIIPIGEPYFQELCMITKHDDEIEKTVLELVRFVPFLPGIEEET